MSLRRAGAVLLILIAAFNLLGFLRAGVGLGSQTSLTAVLLFIALPGVVGVRLLQSLRASHLRKDQLREQTIESELHKLARQHQGRLTVNDVVMALALPAAQVQLRLDAMVRREEADIDFTEDGVVYYTLHGARQLNAPSIDRRSDG